MEPGYYVSIENKWSPMTTRQIEAYNNWLNEQQEMYTMGSSPVKDYAQHFGVSKDGTKYVIMVSMMCKLNYIQLGDGLFHQILVVPSPDSVKPYSFFKDKLQCIIK